MKIGSKNWEIQPQPKQSRYNIVRIKLVLHSDVIFMSISRIIIASLC